MRKKWWIIPVVLLLILVVFNPSMKQYKEFIGQRVVNPKRTSNFLIFSVFESKDDVYTKKHLGILSNFYILNPNVNSYNIPVVTDSVSVVVMDSTVKVGITSIENSNVGIVYHSLVANNAYTHRQLLNLGYTENDIKKLIVNGKVNQIPPPVIFSNPKMKLWGVLGDRNLYSKSFEEFTKQYSTTKAIGKLYDGLFEDNMYSKSENDFYSEYFPDIKPPFDPTKPYTIVKDSTKK